MMTKIVTCLLSSVLVLGAIDASAAKAKRKPNSDDQDDRPPQFVLLAFDGSLNNAFWEESLAFADTVRTTTTNSKANGKLRFTYFVSPVYYLANANKSHYKIPELNKSLSCIGWGGEASSIVPRVDHTNRAFNTGHEIGSHANAHCDASGADSANPLYGHPFTQADWESEFSQFNKILFNVTKLNGVTPSKMYDNGTPLAFTQRDIVGFRAPLLATTKGLWPTLKQFGFRYDTSKSSAPTYWPQRSDWGGWNFPLGELKVSGRKRTVFSMDYNWLYFQTGGVTPKNLTEEQRLAYKNQMLESYKYYFKINYFGGRGPINIGHHFSKWNGGAYWQAMREFAQFVCGKPGVRCVTYREYADWLDSLSPAQYQRYRSGAFPHLPDDHTIKNIAAPIAADIRLDVGNRAFEAVVSPEDRAKLAVFGWKPQLSVNFEPTGSNVMTHDELVNKVGTGNSALIRAAIVNKKGEELDWETHRIDNLGTPEETMTEALENMATQGESAAAHIEE